MGFSFGDQLSLPMIHSLHQFSYDLHLPFLRMFDSSFSPHIETLSSSLSSQSHFCVSVWTLIPTLGACPLGIVSFAPCLKPPASLLYRLLLLATGLGPLASIGEYK